MKNRLLTKTVLACTISFALGTVAAAPYEVVDLGKLSGDRSTAQGINSLGDIIGEANGAINEDTGLREFGAHAVKFQNPNQDLGSFVDNFSSVAIGLNDAGIIVGYGVDEITITDSEGNEFTSAQEFAAVFSDTGPQKLASMDTLGGSRALNINNHSFIVGFGSLDVDPDDTVASVDRGFVYNLNTQEYVHFITPFTDETNLVSYATSINDNNNVVFWAHNERDDGFFEFKSGFFNIADTTQITTLPMLAGAATYAQDINNNDIVVGNAFHSVNNTRSVAFKFDVNNDTALVELGFFRSDFNDSLANAINDSNQIVGRALASSPVLGVYNAFIYEENQLKNLNDLIPCNSGWVLTDARDINNEGKIVGYGVKDGEVRAFLLNPTGGTIENCDTEEPSDNGGGSIPVALLAVLALFGLKRRIKK